MTQLCRCFRHGDLVTSKYFFMWCFWHLYMPFMQSPWEPSFVDQASVEYFSLHITSGVSLMHVKKQAGPSRALLYLVGMHILLLTVRVAVIRVISGGPGQTAPPLPEITDGNVSGNLHGMEGTDSSMSDCSCFCLVRPCVTEVFGLKLSVWVFCAHFVFNVWVSLQNKTSYLTPIFTPQTVNTKFQQGQKKALHTYYLSVTSRSSLVFIICLPVIAFNELILFLSFSLIDSVLVILFLLSYQPVKIGLEHFITF